MTLGNVAIVLAAHRPYLRSAGRKPVGEDALHELIALALLPALSTLYDQVDQNIRPQIGLAFSPLLLEQLGDTIVLKHFGFWLDAWLERLLLAQTSYEQAGDTDRVYLARFYRTWATGIAESFHVRFGRNPLAALRMLCEAGVAEPLASAASWPRLALLDRPETRRVQFELGTLTIARQLGRPQGIWLPDQPIGAATLASAAATGANYAIVAADQLPTGAAHLRAYALAGHRMAAIARNPSITDYLVTSHLNYQGDPLYRSEERDEHGFIWYRNGLTRSDEPYDPYDAYRRAQEHASHFVEVIRAELQAFYQQTHEPGNTIIALDIGMLGARWFEGAAWFASVLGKIATSDDLALVTPGALVRHQSQRRPLTLVADADGEQRNESGRYSLIQALRTAENRLIDLVRAAPDASAEQERLLQQAVRELLLAQTGVDDSGNEEGAPQMLRHLSRCLQLCDLAEQPALSDANLTLLETLEEEDNPFSGLNYRLFGTVA